MPSDDKRASAPSEMIARIAEMLGVPVESFSNGSSEPFAAMGAAELLALWVDLDDDKDRERLLQFARQLLVAR